MVFGIAVARRTYREYVNASPITRLTLEVHIPAELKAERWSRLERRTMTLLLGSMTKTMKDDIITHRVDNVPSLLYRMFVIYQPGGASERASILKHLEGTSAGDNIHDTVQALRWWRRYVQRAEEMGVAVPDASILLRSVELIIAKTLDVNSDIRFRLSLIKNELQLQSRPTQESVIKYHSHALAELQQAAPTRTRQTPTAASSSTQGDAWKLKAVTASGGTGETVSPGGSPSRKPGNKTPCKFFQTDSGCKRGSSCKYDHVFDSKEAKRSRCWECGATTHRRTDCPVAQKNGKGGKGQRGEQGDAGGASASSTSSTTGPSMAALAAAQPPIPMASQQALLESIQQLGSGSSTASTTNDPTTTETTRTQDVQALLQEANAMLSKLTKLAAMKVKPDLKEISAQMERVESEDERRAALLDSGASHSFRSTLSKQEEDEALPVRVELAGGQFITLKQNRGGTLLAARSDPTAPMSPAILPLGAMVQKLGCELQWTRHGGLRVYHPQFGELKTFVKGNHPMLGELQALEIISQLEDMKLRELEGNTLDTKVRLMDAEEAITWDYSLARYVQTGERAHALEALLQPASPLGVLPDGQPALMTPTVNLDNKSGWKYLKTLPIRRSTRRAMMEKRWSVRCFAGDGEADLKVLNSDATVFVDINVTKSKLFTLKDESVAYRALIWAALRGQLEGVLGAVPTNQSEELRNKLMWLWIVAKKAATVYGVPGPYLAMSGSSLSDFWVSESWKRMQGEYQIPLVDLTATETKEVFLIATNLDLERDPRQHGPGGGEGHLERDSRWPPSIYGEIVDGIYKWWRFPNGWAIKKMDATFEQMKEPERRRWIRHVKNGHLPLERRCRTCIETCATGRAHRRVVAPSCYVLSLDLCGPFRVKGDYAGAKGYKYALIGAYVMSKLQGGKEAPIPEYTPEEEEAFEDDDLLDEVGPGDDHLSPEDAEAMKETEERYNKLLKDVGELPEYQVLHYAIPLRTRIASEVDTAVKSLYLQLRGEGLPVTRIHSDRARELRGRDLRSWLIARDVMPTCGESQVPQTNGRAEAAVKRAKRRTKALLTAAGLPRACWPWATTYAAHHQRAHALGRGRGLFPFAAPVHVKNKIFGTGHKYDLDNLWKEGVYMGPAPDIPHGHTVRFPEGRYVSSMHLKSSVIDADAEVKLDEVEMTLPSPSRRLKTKTASTRTNKGSGVGGEDDHLPAEDSDPHHALPGPEEGDPGYGAFEGDELFPELAVDWEDGPVSFEGMHDLPAEDSGPHHALPGRRDVLEASVPSGVHTTKEASVPSGVPSRRVTAKSSLKALRTLSEPEVRAEEMARKLLQMESFEREDALQLFKHLEDAKQPFSRSSTRKPASKTTSWMTGMFTHGGVCGLRDGAKRMPKVTKYLALFAKKVMGIETFGAVGIVKNSSLGCHRDLHNHPNSVNIVYPLSEFSGGSIWVQGSATEDEEEVRREVRPGVWKVGTVKTFDGCRPVSFSPRRWHEVQPHDEGSDRVVLVTYQPRLKNLKKEDRERLRVLGFELGCDVPQEECLLKLVKKRQTHKDYGLEGSLGQVNEAHQQLLEDLQERVAALRILLEEEQSLTEDLREARKDIENETYKATSAINEMIQHAEKAIKELDQVMVETCLKAASVQDDPDYEALVDEMEGDLQVVYTVPQVQVRRAVKKWHKAIKKELDNLFNTGTLRRITMKHALELQGQGKLRLVPSKGVYTMKPPDVPGDRLRRKYRLVLCGNHAAKEEGFRSLYAGGASIETFRAALAYAAMRRWRGAASDITGAFLLSEWPSNLSQYAVQPPRFLVDNGYAEEDECWLVAKPLYGLRESPSIWASYRTSRLSGARIPYKGSYITLQPSTVDKEIWLAYDEHGNERAKGTLRALLVTYVDDLFFLGPTELIKALDEWIRTDWPCSALQWADDSEGARYLGTEIYQRSSSAFELKQTGYIEDLLRAHEMTEACPTKLPCPREWIAEDYEDVVENFTEQDLKMGQRMTGELLWLTMRSRPDLQHVVSHLSQWVSKHPKRIVKIAKRVLSYLAGTSQMKLVIGDYKEDPNGSSNTDIHNSAAHTSNTCTGSTDMGLKVISYSDASFAPTGSRSVGAAVVTINNCPICWKAGRQGMVTLSTMESELLEATQTAILTEGIACLFDEFCNRRVDRVLRVDNAAATAMLQGGPGSWRTRHLKVRSAYVLEQVEQKLLIVEFVEGRKQLADLGTKAHPKARLWELLEMRGFENLPTEAQQIKATRILMLALITLAVKSVPVAEAAEKEPLSLAGVDELFLVLAVCCLGAVAIWEAVKWLGHCMWERAVKGRKAQRLQRMRDLAKAAVETELERTWGESHEAFHGKTTHQRVEGAMQEAMTRAIESSPILHQEPVLRSRGPRTTSVGTQTQAYERPGIAEPQAEYFRFEGPFYMTEHGKNVHLRQDCHGFRLASHRVKAVGYCDWCDGAVPLYIRRERGQSSTR